MLSLVCFIALFSMAHGVYDGRDEALVYELLSALSDDGFENDFDIDGDVVAMDEIRRILESHGFDTDRLLADGDFFGLLDLANGEKKWAPINFAQQISCYQGKSTVLLAAGLYAYIKYNGYGCFCGGGSYSGNYIDETDLCCKKHDECYERAQKKYGMELGCHTYTTTYSFTCCERQRKTKCTNTGPSAGRDLCECDQEMALCVAKNSALSSYNSHNMNNRSRCVADEGFPTKVFSVLDILKTCKHILKPRKTFAQTVPSQGKCPKKKGGGWLWKDENSERRILEE